MILYAEALKMRELEELRKELEEAAKTSPSARAVLGAVKCWPKWKSEAAAALLEKEFKYLRDDEVLRESDGVRQIPKASDKIRQSGAQKNVEC